jgi:hypothetical protein
LVCEPLGIEYDYSRGADYIEDGIVKTHCIEEIVIMPRATVGPDISVLIGEKQGANSAWQRKSIATAELSFAYIELFQWDSYGFLNLPMVRCKITACAEGPDYVGEEALIDIDKVGFYLADGEPIDEEK